ncbi:hypothetical protein CONPUDRAFT_163712 [Coniophora puteana RWD-64-598 SS2]|uniref:DUF6533 domain-containing protein n=1 Tax=Coniophora puteana (strain RWD-64-598) TaxID=741705 RepID=A0A5M3MU92_CONPW|nr:uncharacterized protein CONPUDRAFT_163712 [Coniophora puteana RWD-64-598 SS2]EIW82577.1 hypothetical protein CONPUDRAFT_163712 [Coniophora puteana RWD-64-598 SS2]
MDAAIVFAAKEGQISKLTSYSRLALVVWDIVVNMRREVDLIWRPKFRFSSLLYLMVRYPIIAYSIWAVGYKLSTPHCDALDKFTFSISLFPTRIATIISFAMRVYAVTDRGRLMIGRIMIALLALAGILVVALDIAQIPNMGCSPSDYPLLTALVFISLCVFDVLATAMILTRMTTIVRLNGGTKALDISTLTGVVVASGLMFFVVVTIVQVGAVILYYVPSNAYSTFLNNYTLVLSAVLISRFLLDLREIAYEPDEATIAALRSLRCAAGPAGGKHSTIGFVRDFEDPFGFDIDAGDFERELDAEVAGVMRRHVVERCPQVRSVSPYKGAERVEPREMIDIRRNAMESTSSEDDFADYLRWEKSLCQQ